jgi:hypothetical protein
MRASDADRQRAIDELRRHCAAGRIDVDEFAARVDAVHAAVTLEDLEAVRADLPMMRVAEPAGAGGVWAQSDPGLGRAAMTVVGSAAGRARLVAVAVALAGVAVVLGAVVLVVAAEWVWAVFLLVGWAIGVAQGRAGRRRA